MDGIKVILLNMCQKGPPIYQKSSNKFKQLQKVKIEKGIYKFYQNKVANYFEKGDGKQISSN